MPGKSTTLLIIFFTCLFVSSWVISSSAQDNKTAQAFQYFDERNYAAAEPLFKSLIEEHPESLLLYYYYGASRTENKQYSEHDLIQLMNANTNEAPAKINYYIAIQYHALNNWEQALKYYSNFKQNITAEEQAELKLDEKIQQCHNRQNPFTNTAEAPLMPAPEEQHTVVNENIPLENQPAPNRKVKTIVFKVNSQITYYTPEQFKTEDGRYTYTKAQEKQLEIDNALNQLEILRNRYQLANSVEERNRIGQEIIPLETGIYSIQAEAAQLLIQAERAENNYWENATEEEINDFLRELDSYISIDTENSNEQTQYADNTEYIDPSILFQNKTEPVNEEIQQSDELIYKIQIGAYSRALPAHIDRLFRRLSVLRKIETHTDENGVVVYTTGNLTNYEDAEKMNLQVKQEGVENSVIAPYYNGKRITLDEAKRIERFR